MAPANEAPTKPKPVPGTGTGESVNGPGKPQPGSQPAQPAPTAQPQPQSATKAPDPVVDSNGAGAMDTDTATKSQHQRDVDYTIEFLDELPGEGSGAGRPSVFEDRIQELRDDPTKQKKWARLASYRNGSAASAAANVLRQRHGLPYVEGLHVETRRVDDRTLLFVKLDPDVAEEGGKERWEKVEAERKAKLAAKRAEREAAAQKSSTSTSAAPATSPAVSPAAPAASAPVAS